MRAELARSGELIAGAETAESVERAGVSRVPWYMWAGAAAMTSAFVGGHWDFGWHRSVGRDTFWTPAHMAIYACGVIAGIVGMYLVLTATFGKSTTAERIRGASVTVFGLRAPLGVFVAGWGGMAMLTSAPFDNWWHNAYGLDVTILSPPHTLLILGVRAVDVGMMLLILAAMNRAANASELEFKRLRGLFLYVCGVLFGGMMFVVVEYTRDVNLHRVATYIAVAAAAPPALAMASEASGWRWAATIATAIYSAFLIAFILIFPLVPAEAKLGPVYYPVTHLAPPNFPVLLIAPALALDVFWNRVKSWRMWQIALVSGVIFVAVLVAVEWPFAKFLMSHASQNRFFGTMYFDRNADAGSYERLRMFANPDAGVKLWFGLARAAGYAAIATWIGLVAGRWMRGVRR